MEPEDEKEEGAAGVSPIELIPRIELRHAFTQLSNGSTLSTTTTQLDITFTRRLLIRYELPHARLEGGGQEASGLGDIQFQGIGVLTSGPRHVSALIVGMELDSATQPQLGAGKQQVFFGGGVAAKPVRWLLPYLIVQEQLSFAGDDTRPDVNQLLVRTGLIVFGRRWNWYRADLDTLFNFQNDATSMLGTLEAGSLVVGRIGLFFRAGTQLLGQRQVDYSVQAGIRYLFRLDKKPDPARWEPSKGSQTLPR